MKKQGGSDKLLLLLCALALTVGCIGLTLFPAARFSERENRNLAAFPHISAKGLASGTVSEGMELYATERFPARSGLRRVQAASELLLGRCEVHGVILCRDGSLARRLPVNEETLTINITALPRLRELLGDIPLTLAVAPRRIDVRSEVLPSLYDTAREQAERQALPQDAVTFFDCTEDACWYRTDHHWTTQGAYFAYVRLCEQLGCAPYPESDFSPEAVSTTFYGTSEAAAGIPGIAPDTVYVWRFDGEEEFRVIRDGVPADFEGFYDLDKLNTRDHYSLFLGGNCGVTEITRGENDTRETLLVIKDSFANALLPFLARHYRILAVDPRYRAADVCKLEQGAGQVLVLCGLQTLSESAFIPPLLRK